MGKQTVITSVLRKRIVGISLLAPGVIVDVHVTFTLQNEDDGDAMVIRNHFITACKVLGAERLIIGRECFSRRSTKAGRFYTKHLTIHCGRHSFCSHALAGGRSLVEVKEAAGHGNIATSSIYLHVIGDDDGTVGDLFDFGRTG